MPDVPAIENHTIAAGRPDGGVVTQRTANPCTPVRFRLGPPPLQAYAAFSDLEEGRELTQVKVRRATEQDRLRQGVRFFLGSFHSQSADRVFRLVFCKIVHPQVR